MKWNLTRINHAFRALRDAVVQNHNFLVVNLPATNAKKTGNVEKGVNVSAAGTGTADRYQATALGGKHCQDPIAVMGILSFLFKRFRDWSLGL